MSIRFEWDPAKNDANQRKHGLRFEDVEAHLHLAEAARSTSIDETYPGDELVSFPLAHPQGLITSYGPLLQ